MMSVRGMQTACVGYGYDFQDIPHKPYMTVHVEDKGWEILCVIIRNLCFKQSDTLYIVIKMYSTDITFQKF